MVRIVTVILLYHCHKPVQLMLSVPNRFNFEIRSIEVHDQDFAHVLRTCLKMRLPFERVKGWSF
jgi:hypothetical protein